MKELLTRWVGRPMEIGRLAANPYGLVRGLELQSSTAVLSASEEGNAIHFEDVADPPVAKDERLPGAVQLGREAALEIAHQRLGIRCPTIRFTDPIPMSSLRHLPFPVAVEIQSIGRRHDRRQDKNARLAASQYRAACQALRDSEIVAARGEVCLESLAAIADSCVTVPTIRHAGRTEFLGPWAARSRFSPKMTKACRRRLTISTNATANVPMLSTSTRSCPIARRFTRANSSWPLPKIDGPSWSASSLRATRTNSVARLSRTR